MKVISFSLWGSATKYIDGAIRNGIEAKEIYPDWVCRFYCDNKIPEATIDRLRELGCQVVVIDSSPSWNGLFWRFWAMDDDLEAVIIRDTDSVVNLREQAAVNEWLQSPFCLHGMRDHLEHNVPIMGGMWGCKKPNIEFRGHLRKEMDKYVGTAKTIKGVDQNFLRDVIWPRVRSKMLVHDKFLGRVFKLPNGEIVPPSELEYYNQWPETDYPNGSIKFKHTDSFQRLDVYEFNAVKYFGPHEIRQFPHHSPLKYGTYVGEIIE